MEFGRWQTWHFAWRIGATSFANVTASVCDDRGADVAASVTIATVPALKAASERPGEVIMVHPPAL
jgi:hypothetical protein